MKSGKGWWAEVRRNYRQNVQQAPPGLRLLGWTSLLLAGPALACTILSLAAGQSQLAKYVDVNAWLILGAISLTAYSLISERAPRQRAGLIFLGALWMFIAAWDGYRVFREDFGNPWLMVSPVRVAWEAVFAASILCIGLMRKTRDFIRPAAE